MAFKILNVYKTEREKKKTKMKINHSETGLHFKPKVVTSTSL